MQMTYRKAIIILDRLVTTERIEVDREELREAVKVAQKALNIVADLPPNHGRLIDADEFKKKLEKHREMCGDIELAHGIDVAIRILENAPTIIEEEVSDKFFFNP